MIRAGLWAAPFSLPLDVALTPVILEIDRLRAPGIRGVVPRPLPPIDRLAVVT